MKSVMQMAAISQPAATASPILIFCTSEALFAPTLSLLSSQTRHRHGSALDNAQILAAARADALRRDLIEFLLQDLIHTRMQTG